MKVNEGLKEIPNIRESVNRELNKAGTSKSAGFRTNIMHAEKENYDSKLKSLAESIVLQGEKLAKKLDIGELRIYKRMFKELLDKVLKDSHKFSKESFLDRRGRHRVLALVKKINNELDELTKKILADEKDNVGILGRIDELRGLVVDLFM